MSTTPVTTLRQRHGSVVSWPALLALLSALLMGGLPMGAHAAITYVGARNTAAVGTASSMALNGPVGLATGDLMIATVSQAGAAVNWTAPAGWTTLTTSNGTQSPRLVAWYRVATGADTSSTSYTFTSSASAERGGGIMAFRGVNTSTPIASSAIQAYAAVTNVVAPSITPGVANTMLVAIWGFSDSVATVPAAMTASIPHGSGAANANLMSAYQAVSASTATGTRTLSTLDSVTSNAVLLALTPAAGASTVDHYELSLPTSSLTCLPTTVTVTACTDASSPCSNPATTLSGTSATLATAGATLGTATVTFNAGGVATTTLSYPAAANGTAASVTLSGEQTAATNARQCCPNGTSCSAANSCSTTFNTAGFIIAAAANGAATTLPTQTAGSASSTYYLRAVQSSTTTAACVSALTGSTSVNWAYECNNPTACSASNLMSLTGNSATTIQRNNNAAVASYTAVPMTFDASGNAPFSFSFSDVGRATLWASKTVNSAVLSGSSNAFVTKPAGFAISAIAQTAAPNLANPAAANASGAKFVKAGESFGATVTAQTSSGAATPNYGKETSPEGVLLTPSLLLPSGGASGTLSNATIAGGSFSSGAATVTNLAFSEVGIITITPSAASGSYLGVGAVSGSTSANIGRFVPVGYVLSGGTVTHRSGLGCSPVSAFSYLGENFRLDFTLTARNLAGATTQNYTGSFAKLDPTAASGWSLAGIDTAVAQSFTAGNARLSLGSATGSWSNGVATSVTITASAARAAAPDGPFSAAFGVAPVDSDGVAMLSFNLAPSGGANDHASVAAAMTLRFGRLRLSNAIGAADRGLSLPVVAQYWDGTSFSTNALDSCTSLSTSALNFGNIRRTLTTADTVAAGGITIGAGVGSLRLSAPGGGRSGTYDVALSLGSGVTDASCLQSWTPAAGKAATAGANFSYLRGAWCGSTYDKDPSARAAFGLQRTQNNTVYRREDY